jgi:hypothetical protein
VGGEEGADGVEVGGEVLAADAVAGAGDAYDLE